MLSDPAALLQLCVDSVSTFCVLGRHALVAAGMEAKTERRAVVQQISDTLKMDVTPFETLLDVREDKTGRTDGMVIRASCLRNICDASAEWWSLWTGVRSRVMKVGLIVFGVVVLIALVLGGSLVSAHNNW